MRGYKYNQLFVMALMIPLFAVAGCSGAKKQLGISKSKPDEFSVVKRAPLEMPPDYVLRPPRPGATRPQESEMSAEAETAVFGRGAKSNVYKPDSAEEALLYKAGAKDTDDNIRQIVDEETAALAPDEKPVSQRIFGIMGSGDEPAPASVLDAKGEAERLRKNASEGRPLNEGETAVAE